MPLFNKSDMAPTNESNFFSLPRELQLEILENMTIWEYIRFSLAFYSQLRWTYPDYFPAVTGSRLRSMRNGPSPGLQDPFQTLPNEMIDNIARNIPRRDLLRWVFAHYYALSNRNPPSVPSMDRRNADDLAGIMRAWLDENID